jgi:hypothetical protein
MQHLLYLRCRAAGVQRREAAGDIPVVVARLPPKIPRGGRLLRSGRHRFARLPQVRVGTDPLSIAPVEARAHFVLRMAGGVHVPSSTAGFGQ